MIHTAHSWYTQHIDDTHITSTLHTSYPWYRQHIHDTPSTSMIYTAHLWYTQYTSHPWYKQYIHNTKSTSLVRNKQCHPQQAAWHTSESIFYDKTLSVHKNKYAQQGFIATYMGWTNTGILLKLIFLLRTLSQNYNLSWNFGQYSILFPTICRDWCNRCPLINADI